MRLLEFTASAPDLPALDVTGLIMATFKEGELRDEHGRWTLGGLTSMIDKLGDRQKMSHQGHSIRKTPKGYKVRLKSGGTEYYDSSHDAGKAAHEGKHHTGDGHGPKPSPGPKPAPEGDHPSGYKPGQDVSWVGMKGDIEHGKIKSLAGEHALVDQDGETRRVQIRRFDDYKKRNDGTLRHYRYEVRGPDGSRVKTVSIQHDNEAEAEAVVRQKLKPGETTHLLSREEADTEAPASPNPHGLKTGDLVNGPDGRTGGVLMHVVDDQEPGRPDALVRWPGTGGDYANMGDPQHAMLADLTPFKKPEPKGPDDRLVKLAERHDLDVTHEEDLVGTVTTLRKKDGSLIVRHDGSSGKYVGPQGEIAPGEVRKYVRDKTKPPTKSTKIRPIDPKEDPGNWLTTAAAPASKAAAMKVYGETPHRWNDITGLYKSSRAWGQMDWEGTMKVERGVYPALREALDPGEPAVSSIHGLTTWWHEMHHSIGSQANNWKEASDYGSKGGHDIEEGFTELGSWATMPQFAKALGIDKKQTTQLEDKPEWVRAKVGAAGALTAVDEKLHAHQIAHAPDSPEWNAYGEKRARVQLALNNVTYLPEGTLDATQQAYDAVKDDTDLDHETRGLADALGRLKTAGPPKRLTLGEFFDAANRPETFLGNSHWSRQISYPNDVKHAYEWLDLISDFEGDTKAGTAARHKRNVELSVEINKTAGPSKRDVMVMQYLRAHGLQQYASEVFSDAPNAPTVASLLADHLGPDFGKLKAGDHTEKVTSKMASAIKLMRDSGLIPKEAS